MPNAKKKTTRLTATVIALNTDDNHRQYATVQVGRSIIQLESLPTDNGEWFVSNQLERTPTVSEAMIEAAIVALNPKR